MYADDLLVLIPSPEGLQKSINVYLLKSTQRNGNSGKVNTKKSNIIIFSGNDQTKNNENFQYMDQKHYLSSTNKHIWDSSGRYTYARDILSKKSL